MPIKAINFDSVKQRLMVLGEAVSQRQWLKAGNLVLTYINMLLRPLHVCSYPLTVVVDPGNVCNLSCRLCITGQRSSARPRRLLSFPQFKKIIDQVGRWAIRLDLYNWGEPLLNPELVTMIRYAKNRWKLRVEISTNLLLMTPALARGLIDSGVDRIIVSLHGGSEKTVQSYMQGGSFRLASTNLKKLIRLRNSLGLASPLICWRCVITSFNEHEIPLIRLKAKQWGVDQLELLPVKIDVGFNPDEATKRLRAHSSWLPKTQAYRLYNRLLQPVNKLLDCYWPWEIISINADGSVQPCCVYSHPQFDFGNIFHTKLATIWNGKYYRIARQTIKHKDHTNRQTICGWCVASHFLAK